MHNKKLFPSDEGHLAALCYIKDNQIVIDFGKSLTWLSLGEVEAEAFIKVLQNRVDKLKKKS